MKTIINAILIVWCVAYSGWTYSAQPAQITPLAKYSLMTDITSYKNTLIAVGEMGHVLYSKDQGQSWHQGDLPVDNLLTSVTLLNEKTAWAVGHDGVVLKTIDGGMSWQLIYRTLDHSDDRFVDPLLDVTFWSESDGITVGAFGQYYLTKDGGQSWQDLSETIPNEDELHFNSILRTPENQIFIASEYGSLFHSQDGGASWDITPLPAEATFFDLAFDPALQQVVIAGIAGNIFSYDINTDVVVPIPVRAEKSIYQAQFFDQQLHLVGAKGIWQRGDDLQIDTDRTDYHAITRTDEGNFFVATSSGVKKVIETELEEKP